MESKESIALGKKCSNQYLYWKYKEEQAKEGKHKARQRLLEYILSEYKDRLPIRGNYTIITIDKYTIQIDNVQDTYVISNLFEEVEPREPVTLESATAEGAPSWAIAAITALEQSTKEE